MQKTIGHKWLLIIFLLVTGTAFVAMVYHFIAAIRTPDPQWQTAAAALSGEKQNQVPLKTDRVQYMNIRRDQAKSIGNIRIAYKGLADDHVMIDLTVLPLDPQTTYRYYIPVNTAKKGFTLFEQHLTLVTARKGRIRISIPPVSKLAAEVAIAGRDAL